MVSVVGPEEVLSSNGYTVPKYFIEVMQRPGADAYGILPLYLLRGPRGYPLREDVMCHDKSEVDRAKLRPLAGQLMTGEELEAVVGYLQSCASTGRLDYLACVPRAAPTPLGDLAFSLGYHGKLPLRHLPLLFWDTRARLRFPLREYYATVLDGDGSGSDSSGFFVEPDVGVGRWCLVSCRLNCAGASSTHWHVAQYAGDRRLLPYEQFIRYWEPRHNSARFRWAEWLAGRLLTEEEGRIVAAFLMANGAYEVQTHAVEIPLVASACAYLEYCYDMKTVDYPAAARCPIPIEVQYNRYLDVNFLGRGGDERSCKRCRENSP